MMSWYILDEENNPIKTDSLSSFKWMEKNKHKKFVKREHIGDIFISTVFLGLDHSWNSHLPVLWETMIFGGEHDQYQDRYTSYEDAIKGHEEASLLVKKSLKWIK
jgi:hypothetical protein